MDDLSRESWITEINLTVMKCVLTVIVSFVVTQASNYQYDYDEDVVEAIRSSNKTDSGARLIGARAVRQNEAPFVVAIARVSLNY